MLVEKNVSLQPHNSFGIAARALQLLRVRSEADVADVLADPELRVTPKFVLGGGSNIVLTGDVRPLVLKVEIAGRRLVEATPRAWVVEAGGGENWHDFVAWTLAQGWPGLENLALIPGTVGASPVQNIGAYGVELQDRFHSLDAIDLATGRAFTLDAAQCAFGYRDSIFKHPSAAPGLGLAGQALITRVRFALPRPWKPVLGYADLERRLAEAGLGHLEARHDLIGCNAILAGASRATEPPEVRVRVSVRCETAEQARRVTREVEALYLNGPAGGGGATQSVREVIAADAVLIPREWVQTQVEVLS